MVVWLFLVEEMKGRKGQPIVQEHEYHSSYLAEYPVRVHHNTTIHPLKDD